MPFELLRTELCCDQSKGKEQGSYLYTYKPQKQKLTTLNQMLGLSSAHC